MYKEYQSLLSHLSLRDQIILTYSGTMKKDEFDNLSLPVQMSLLFAMYLRNSMENFHVQYLSDEQMKELNPIIHQAFYNMFRYVKLSSKRKSTKSKVCANRQIDFQVMLIPDYSRLYEKSISGSRS